MASALLERIAEDTKRNVKKRPSFDVTASIREDKLRYGALMINRIDALRAYGYYNGSGPIFNEPVRFPFVTTGNFVSFESQLDWLIEQAGDLDQFENNPGLIIEMIENGVVVFISDFTYVQITRDVREGVSWYDVRVVAIFGNEVKGRWVDNLLKALTSRHSWIDHPNPRKVFKRFDVGAW